MSRRKDHWAPEEDEQLKSALQKKVSVQRLAVRLKRSETAIKLRIRQLRLGLPRMVRLEREAPPKARWVAKRIER